MKTRLSVTFVLVVGTALLVLLALNWIQPTVVAQSQPASLDVSISKLDALAARTVAPVPTPKPNVLAPDPVPGSTHVAAALQGAPLMFVENVGQFDADVRFQVRRGDTTIYLADDAIWFTILESASEGAEARKGVNLKLSFPGANPHPRLEPFDRLDTHVSYFVGSDPDNWRTDVPAWGGVRYVDVYPGVDVEITGKGGHWAWRLVAHNPQSTALHIRLRIDGADALALGDGDYLHLTTTVGEFRLPLLQTTPSNLPSVRPEIKGAEIIAPFSSPASFPLVPQNAGDSYSTFLGGSGDDISNDVAVDGDGDAYVVGSTTSADFPVSTGAFSDTLIGGQDDFVFKIHPAGDGTNDRVYATYIGGGAGDAAGGIAVDGDENVYITGWSNNFFPDTPGSFASCDGGGAFVTKLNDTGTALLYSGCLAGINAEGQDITLDDTGQAYVSGRTGNTFLTTSGAYQETYGGGDFDAFLAIVSSDGVTLTYATYLGGDDDECKGSTSGCTLDLDGSNNVYLAGDTESANFPDKNAYDSTCGVDGSCDSSRDLFLSKLNPAGSGASDLLYSTFIGHDGQENSGGVAVDGSGNAYLTGQTSSTSFPTTPGAFSGNHNGGWGDAFLLKLNPAGGGSSDLLYSTYLGGSGPGDKGFDIDVDENGHAYAVGTTNSSNFTTTAGSYDTSLGGTADAYIVKLDPAGNGQADLLYGAFLGGDNGTETAYGLVVDGVDNVNVTGVTEADDFRTSVGAFDTSFNSGTHDAFFVRLGISDTVTLTATVDFDAPTYSVGEGDGLATVAVTLSAPSALSVTVDYATSDGTATAPGDYTMTGNTLTFTPGLTKTTFTVAINDDELVENNETLILTLSNAVNANIGDNNPATLTIIDNDDPPTGERLPFYSTFLGGSGDDTGDDVTVDGDGDAYVFGTTTSADFPVSTGAFSNTLIGGQDDFVFKIHPAGDGTNDRVYATYIGGSAGDSAGGIAVDGDENVYITGWSNNFFPDTPGSFASCDGGGAFVTKLNDTGTALLYSGCLAGINAEGQDITLDSTGQAYVSGKTGDTFLTTSGAYQETYGGGDFDAFLAVVSSDGVTLTYASYLGGDDDECIGSTSGCTLDLDGSDNVYLAGDTESANFPTQNAYDSTCGVDGSCDSSRDLFLSKLNPAGGGASDLLYSTFIGHDGQENSGGVAVDGSGNAYLTGQTSSTSFPTTSGAYSENHNGGWGDAFLLKLNPAGGGSSDLLYSTYLGGSGPGDKGFDIAVDENNHAYAVGTTNSSNFPTTPGSYDTSLGSTTDAFVVKLNPAGNGQADLLYGAFLGGDNGTETGYGLVVDDAGNIYVTGETTADDFPTSVGAFDRTFNSGTHDAFFVRLSTAKLYIYLPLVLRNS